MPDAMQPSALELTRSSLPGRTRHLAFQREEYAMQLDSRMNAAVKEIAERLHLNLQL